MGSYKHVACQSNVSAISDAISSLEELGSECREIVDNASENLQQTSRIQTFEETASTLEGISEPDIPDCIADLPINYNEQRSTRKGRGESRAVRRDNALAVISAAREAADEWINTRTGEHEDAGSSIDDDEEAQAVVEFVGELENLESDIEGCEFPGMYG
ncbi:hypothetical protein [Xylella phage Bacata]|nr:hypothetical protein JT315_gp58 [Xylella phage Bacata]CAA2367836.1 hypothetical protein [Xylella phage Bacata]